MSTPAPNHRPPPPLPGEALPGQTPPAPAYTGSRGRGPQTGGPSAQANPYDAAMARRATGMLEPDTGGPVRALSEAEAAAIRPDDTLEPLHRIGLRASMHELTHNLVHLIEEKDASTAAHTWRVVLYTRAVCEEHGLSPDFIERATLGAALHDVGKLDTPDDILTKPARLTPEEFEVIKQHPVTGYARMVRYDIRDQTILDLITAHHERWDGKGYPFGISGEEIPIIARYFAVIDTFDALTSIRPYRQEVGRDAADRALGLIHASRGRHFWPDAVDVFLDLYRRGSLDFILSHFNDKADLPRFGADPAATIRRTRA